MGKAATDSVKSMPSAGRVYLTGVILVGLGVVSVSLFKVYLEPLGYQWYMLAALTLISGSATVKLPSVPASISVSETFVFASVLLFGPAAGTIMVALDGLVISFWIAQRRPEWYRALFNMAAPAVSIWLAAELMFAIGGFQPLVLQPITVNVQLAPLILFAIIYFGLNSWLIAIAVSFETGLTPYRVWRDNFLWLSLNYFSGASVSLLLVVYTRDIDLRFIGVIVPLLLVLYFTFKTSMGRVEDAHTHLHQLNRLYLSTIETLAMAIDAKDQITHGHIRRVQLLAVGLAKRVGVLDESLIRAIEAAALLHDMGKLAIPEYILNKPGRLTEAEFEKMKLHASVGADILSAIDFPYPVVPIVRHHHENWDGSGYPTGLRGTEIPIGARILSVVDCFDALTSDRPYRPRLSTDDAIRILIQRRGSMYDPLVVDAFLASHEELTAEAFAITPPQRLLERLSPTSTRLGTESRTLEDIVASADEMFTMYELARAVGGQTTAADIGYAVVKHLKRLVPFSLCVLFVHDTSNDELRSQYVTGEHAASIGQLRIALGQRLSGWVGATRQTIVNSDPFLDLGEIARHPPIELRSCISAPIIADSDLVGVLSLYAAASNAYGDEHRRIIEVVAQQISDPLRNFVGVNAHRIQHLPVSSATTSESLRLSAVPISTHLITVRIQPTGDVHPGAELGASDEVRAQVAAVIRQAMRSQDSLFRSGPGELIVVVNGSDNVSAASEAAKISDLISATRFVDAAGNEQQLAVAFQVSVAAQHGVEIPHASKSAMPSVGSRPSDGTAKIH